MFNSVESEVGEEDPTSTSAEAAKNTLLRRSTRATSKTPAETSIGKEPKKTTKKGKEQASSALKQAESATIRELLGASLAKGTGTGRKPDEERTHAKVTALLIHHLANDLVNTERELARQTENQSNKRTNLATVLDLAVKALLAGDTAQANRLFDFCAAFGAEAKEKRNELGEERMASIGTSYTLVVGPKDTGKTKRFEPIGITGIDGPGQENILPGGIPFNDNARPSSDDIGFIPHFEKNLRDLHGLLPLTIFNATWQAKAINHHTSHGTKKSKAEDTGKDKTKYSGLPYPDQYTQSYANWSMNYQGFLDALFKTDGFMTGLRYDIHVRFNTFTRRIVMEDGSQSIANISIFNETVQREKDGIRQVLVNRSKGRRQTQGDEGPVDRTTNKRPSNYPNNQPLDKTSVKPQRPTAIGATDSTHVTMTETERMSEEEMLTTEIVETTAEGKVITRKEY
ncbi:hypothetical protein PSTG_13100 [Puccinia striiformis f. sp. tritici PST-78]|uniref:Uncharacterized protein n=1 Tax=Puccinia striiformis f. sp. tritici PST-78 TaxID=1165861 RepID=A0A0L0V2R4_9BASI|nr:hypothetical protein PSTG_13100 [Puccinia striiformis f. sp. tritici PST-78]